MSVMVRGERAEDNTTIQALITESFGGNERRKRTVFKLRQEIAPLQPLSLVAYGDDDDNHVLGSLRFWPCLLPKGEEVPLLGPLVVSSKARQQGIGTALIQEGLARAKAMNYSGVLIVGNPDYYGKFGFRADVVTSLTMPGPVVPLTFMGLCWQPQRWQGVTGDICRIYPPPTNTAEANENSRFLNHCGNQPIAHIHPSVSEAFHQRSSVVLDKALTPAWAREWAMYLANTQEVAIGESWLGKNNQRLLQHRLCHESPLAGYIGALTKAEMIYSLSPINLSPAAAALINPPPGVRLICVAISIGLGDLSAGEISIWQEGEGIVPPFLENSDKGLIIVRLVSIQAWNNLTVQHKAFALLGERLWQKP